MIDPRYVRTMARYNSWQNAQLMPVLQAMPLEDLKRDRGGFFGGLLETANHLLWADMLWMSRFDPSVEAPEADLAGSPSIHPTASAWSAARFHLDGKIRFWADGLRALDLKQELTWFSSVANKTMTASLEMCIAHFFNHQTHHRGQLHAMLTAAGCKAPVSDLLLMPEDF